MLSVTIVWWVKDQCSRFHTNTITGFSSPELSVSLLQINANELDKTWDYISVSFNDINLYSLITPVNHKGESQLFCLIFLLFFIEHGLKQWPKFAKNLSKWNYCLQNTKANTNHQSRSKIYDLHVRTLHGIRIWLSELFCLKLTWKGSNPARCTSFTQLLSQSSTVQFTAFPFTRTQLQF